MTLKDKLQALQSQCTPVQIDSIGECIWIKPMSAKAVIEIYEIAKGGDNGAQILREHAIIASVCDESGQPVFSSDDFALLNSLPNIVIQEMFAAVSKVNKLGMVVEDEKKG